MSEGNYSSVNAECACKIAEYAAGAAVLGLVVHAPKMTLVFGVIAAYGLVNAAWNYKCIPDWLGFALGLFLIPICTVFIFGPMVS